MNTPMFASVLHLDRKAVHALKITDPYAIHRVVYSLFEDVRTFEEKKSGKPSGIIYADQGGTVHGRQVLIVSDRRPVSAVNGRYGSVESKEITQPFLDFNTYRFKVIMNPCIRDNKTRKLVPMKSRAAVHGWFVERSEKSWGFSADNKHLQVDKMEVIQFTGKKHQQITIARASLQGFLDVTDKEKFKNSFQQGIGRGRAFGCGLLQIVPQPHNLF